MRWSVLIPRAAALMQATLMFSELSFAQNQNDPNAGNRNLTFQLMQLEARSQL
jgi:hypothetical protein